MKKRTHLVGLAREFSRRRVLRILCHRGISIRTLQYLRPRGSRTHHLGRLSEVGKG